MAERPDLPRIKPHKAPSLINREMTEYAWMGGILGTFAALLARGKGLGNVVGFMLGGQAIGGIFGALKGKAREEREMVEGRVVKDPSIWNGGFFTGEIVGGWINMGIMAVTGKALGIFASLPSIAAPVIGMIMRKNEMRQDFDEAVAIRKREIGERHEKIRTLESTAAQKQGPFMNSVNAGEAAALASKQEQKPVHAELRDADAPAPETARGT